MIVKYMTALKIRMITTTRGNIFLVFIIKNDGGLTNGLVSSSLQKSIVTDLKSKYRVSAA